MPPRTLARQAYHSLHARILGGELQPGSVLSEEALARQLGMSRTPVGEAMRQLAAEGLVEQVPRFGTVVRGLSREDLVELFEMREALESFAAERAAERITPTQLAQLEALCAAMQRQAEELRRQGAEELASGELQAFLATDLAFHLVIVQASGNRRLQQAVAETRALSGVFRLRRQRHDASVVEQAHAWHRRIFEALAAGNAPLARATMAEHIALSREQSLAVLARDESRGGPALPAELPEELVRELARLEEEGP